jgi:hypothetical protein
MSDTVEALIADLLEYVSTAERSYDDVMEAWHTSCPKLPVWEEANDRVVTRVRANGHAVVRITTAGTAFLEQRRRSPLH